MDQKNAQIEAKLHKQIRLEEIRLLYGGSLFSFTAAIIISFIIFTILFDNVASETNLKIWLAIILFVMFIRSIDCYLFSKANKQEQQKNSWRTRFFIGTGIAGVCWGLLPWLGYSSSPDYFAFIIVCQIGVIAGSLSTLSYRWETLALFLLPSSLLLVARLIVENQSFSNPTSIVLSVFIFFSLFAGKRIFNNTQQNIRLRIEADNREHAIALMHQKQALHRQNTPLAIVEFDLELQIEEWNPAAESIFGYSHDEAIGKNIMHLILPEDNEAEQLSKQLLNHEAVIGKVIENRTKSGNVIFCEWFITPLTDEKNNIVGLAAMALDITEKKHNDLVILKAKEEAEKANQAKSDFLSSMSHELRTPLNAILGFTQLLKYEKLLTDKQQSHINEINNAGNLLLELVNQILDLARIEKGHLQLSMERVSLADVFTECRSMITPLAEQNNLTLDIPTDLTGHVIADYTRLKQVMLNILSNAIKYNVKNGTVSLQLVEKENNIIRICIIDTGEGISKELLSEIFQPFNRLNAACNIEGTGIGLSISKQLIEMMNGTIGVNSTVNQGSEFWIELPGTLNDSLHLTNKKQTKATDKLAYQQASFAHNILVAEDNPTNQTLIIDQLKTLGYTADMAANGQEALNLMVNNDYQILITDCNMPLIDGYKLAKIIREKGNQGLPIIALTADAFPDKKVKCIEAGMNDHITKPVSLETLKDTIEKYLN